MRRALAPLLLALALAACTRPRTEILVEVHSDLQVPDMVSRLLIEVRDPSGEVERSEADLTTQGFPRTLGLVHTGGPLGAFEMTVTGYGPAGGDPLITREARFAFQEGRTLVLRIYLSRDCVALPCPDGSTTCGNDGVCRSIEIDPSELETYNSRRDGGFAEDSSVMDASDEDSSADAAAPSPCLMEPSPQDCVQCFCEEDSEGCRELLSLYVEYVYCGRTCSSHCSSFCADPSSPASGPCTTCIMGASVEGNEDYDRFVAMCAMSARCAAHDRSVAMCFG